MAWIEPQLQQINSNFEEDRASSVSLSNGSEMFFVGKKAKNGSSTSASDVGAGGGPVGKATRKFRCDNCAGKFMSQEMVGVGEF